MSELELIIQDMVDERAVPTHLRRFGPSFEKPCLRWETIICMMSACQEKYQCKLIQAAIAKKRDAAC